jgi:hypothetical protein
MNKEKTFSCYEAGCMLSSAALKGIDYLVESLLPKINENLGGNQSILCINILADMFTAGNH